MSALACTQNLPGTGYLCIKSANSFSISNAFIMTLILHIYTLIWYLTDVYVTEGIHYDAQYIHMCT